MPSRGIRLPILSLCLASLVYGVPTVICAKAAPANVAASDSGCRGAGSSGASTAWRRLFTISPTALPARVEEIGFARRLRQASIACPRASAPQAAVNEAGLPLSASNICSISATERTMGQIKPKIQRSRELETAFRLGEILCGGRVFCETTARREEETRS